MSNNQLIKVGDWVNTESNIKAAKDLGFYVAYSDAEAPALVLEVLSIDDILSGSHGFILFSILDDINFSKLHDWVKESNNPLCKFLSKIAYNLNDGAMFGQILENHNSLSSLYEFLNEIGVKQLALVDYLGCHNPDDIYPNLDIVVIHDNQYVLERFENSYDTCAFTIAPVLEIAE